MARRDPFSGAGEVRALARAIDWSDTSLGPVDQWPDALAAAVDTCLDSPFPIALWCEPDLVFIYNDAYRAVLGRKHPWALGRSGSEVWAEIWSEAGPMFDGIRAGGPPIFREDAPFVVRRDGSRSAEGPDDAVDGSVPSEEESGEPNAWFTFSLSPIRDDAGRLVAFLNIVSESTARMRAERASEAALDEAERAESRLREVFAQAPSFLAVLRGPDHVFESVNEAYHRLVGRRDLVGRPAFEALPEVRDQGFEQLLDQVLETGEPFVGREVPFMVERRAPGEPERRYVDLVYYPITEADGTRSGVVAHGSDVTEHVLARRQAQEARVEAERANLAKSQFLATMSHEIRTPLNAVLGYADLLDAGVSGELADGQRRFVKGIRASGRHLLGLIDDILDLAKIEAGEMIVELGEFEARSVVRQALQIVAPQAEGRELEIVETWECDDDVQVKGDEDRTRQILLNLLANSLKFTEPGGRIRLGCRTAEEAPTDTALPDLGPWFVIDVEDTGRGVSEAQLARVFEPFVQGEAGHTRSAGGAGLGLTISRRLARLMGGELTVRSEVGVGSSFSLWLPSAVQERVAKEPGGVEAADVWPPRAEERIGLAAAGSVLLERAAEVEQVWMARLRADPGMQSAKRLNRAQLADQTAELVTAMGKVLLALEEGGGDPGLLDDAEAIQSLVASRHGRQRARLGFGRGDVEREYLLLGEVVDEMLRREMPKMTAANLRTARAVARRLVQRAFTVSMSVYDGQGG